MGILLYNAFNCTSKLDNYFLVNKALDLKGCRQMQDMSAETISIANHAEEVMKDFRRLTIEPENNYLRSSFPISAGVSFLISPSARSPNSNLPMRTLLSVFTSYPREANMRLTWRCLPSWIVML